MRNIWINELYTEVQSMSTFHTHKQSITYHVRFIILTWYHGEIDDILHDMILNI